MSKCQKCQANKHFYMRMRTHARIYTRIHAREINWHFDILTFLEFILLIFSVLIDLQKLHFWFFIFASPNFCKSKHLSLIGKTNYLDGMENWILGVWGHEKIFRYKSFDWTNWETQRANLAAIWRYYKFFLV